MLIQTGTALIQPPAGLNFADLQARADLSDRKWSLALSRLRSAGVTPEDLITALSECRQKNLVIASLASIVNPAIIAMSRRTGSRASPSNPAEQGLIGHSDIQILRRYLKQTNQDMHKAQIKGSPVAYLRL